MVAKVAWAVIAGLALPLTASAQVQTAPESCVGVVEAPIATATSGEATAPANAAVAQTAAPAPTRIVPAVPNAATDSIPHVADSTLVRNLRKGGYVLFFRHAMTNWNERDGAEGDFANRAKQRNLSGPGRAQAAALGKAIAALGIPIEKVLASPMWRCRDTAQLAFGAYDTTIMLYGKGPTFREARIKMLGTAPAMGKNLVLVGHQDHFIPIVPGLKRDQLKEGDALVFQPLGSGTYRVVTQVTPAEWAKLAGTRAPPAANEPVPAEVRLPPFPNTMQPGQLIDSVPPARAINPNKVKK
jgi:phosphohistidine phosphatase SixA